MKKIAYLLSVAALIACSESENIAEVDDGFLAEDESSSSVEVQSSSVEKPGEKKLSSGASKL